MTAPNDTAAPAEVWYRGDTTSTAGPHAVIIETGGHEPLGLLHHVTKHSPTGFSWGFEGSGPADLARSLLIAVLGDDAKCATCRGCRNIIWPKGRNEDAPGYADPIPFDGAIMDQCDPDSVSSCYDCDDGYRRLPYQEFKREFVARWGDSWRISRAEVLQWLADHSE
jgi:hypothetical protein